MHPLAVEHNLLVWLDKDDLHNRKEFPEQLVDAIRKQSCAFALFLTDQEITPWMKKEINHAVKRQADDQKPGKIYPLIPFYAQSMKEGVPLPLSLDT